MTGALANSENPDEEQHNAAFHQGPHCLQRLKQPSGIKIYHNLESSTCDPLKYSLALTFDYSIRLNMVHLVVYLQFYCTHYFV